jgi:hypothetical protein
MLARDYSKDSTPSPQSPQRTILLSIPAARCLLLNGGVPIEVSVVLGETPMWRRPAARAEFLCELRELCVERFSARW